MMKKYIVISMIFVLFSCSETNTTKKDKVLKLSQEDISKGIDFKTMERFFINKHTEDTLFGGERFFKATDFKHGYSFVSKKNNDKIKNGVINTKGEKVVPIKFDEEFIFYKDGYFQIKKKTFIKKKAIYEDRYGYIDTTGKVIINPIYKVARQIINNQLIIKTVNNKWSIINLKGEKVIPIEYDWIGYWHDNLAVIKLNKKWGYINKKNEPVIEMKYSFATDFEQGVAICKKNNKYGIIDTLGNIISPFVYEKYKQIVDVHGDFYEEKYETNKRFSMEEGYIILKKNGKWGFLNINGETIIPFEFDNIGVPPRGQHKVAIIKSNKKGMYNIKDKKVEWEDTVIQ